VVEFFTENASVLSPLHGIYLWRKKNNAEATSYATLNLIAYAANDGGQIESIDDIFDNINNYGGQQWENYYAITPASQWTISTGQGFFVAGKNSGSNVTFTNMMRTTAASGQPFFRNNPGVEPEVSRLWLNLNSSGNFSQIAVAYTDSATLGLDFGMDSRQFSSANISLYSLSEDEKLVIQARPAFEDTDVVPLGYSAETAGSYSLSLHRTDGIFQQSDIKIFLKDNLLDVTHNLADGAYNFTTEAGAVESRFEIVYSTNSLGMESASEHPNDIIIFKNSDGIHLDAGTETLADIKICDMRGRLIYHKGNVDAAQVVITDLAAEQQVLIIQATTTEGIIVAKKVIN